MDQAQTGRAQHGAGTPRKAPRKPLHERIDYASTALFCAAGALGLAALGAAAQLLGIGA